jgi:hypothetical protein
LDIANLLNVNIDEGRPLAPHGIALTFSRRYLKDGIFPRRLWLLPLRDLLAFVTWALSFLGSRVRWRGHIYRLSADGRIEEEVSVRTEQ